MNNFTYSNDGLHLTESSEGCKLQAYQDIAGVWTIGYGHTKGVSDGDVCTQEEAESYLLSDVQACATAVNNNATIPLSQNEFDALVDFSFNLGIGALEHSTLWKYLNAGDITNAALQFPKWDFAGGKVVKGLFERRTKEAQLFIGDL